MRLTDNPVFGTLKAHHETLADMRFDDVKSDSARQQAMSLSLDDLVIDLSRHLMAPQTLNLLAELAEAADVAGQFARLFSGELMNVTEKRPVLHMAAAR